MIKQDIICTCKEDVDTEKKYIYIREIYIRKRVSFYYELCCHLLHVQSRNA